MNVKRTVEKMWIILINLYFRNPMYGKAQRIIVSLVRPEAHHRLVFDFHYHLESHPRYGGWHSKIAQSHLYAPVQDPKHELQ